MFFIPKTLNTIGKIFGYDYVLGVLIDTEKSISNAIRHAHDILVKEELGINAEELKGSAVEAAVYSFILFAIGAVIPVLPSMFASGMKAVIISVSLSAAGLFVIGAAITLFTGKNV